MKVLIAALILWVLFPGSVRMAAAGAGVSTDGSLVLSGQSGKPGPTSKESLAVLLDKEIEVFIFRHQTRVWRGGPAAAVKVPRPELEGLIHKYANLHGVDPSLVRSVMRHESGFNPRAVSPKGAQGLMQLMPGTAELMGVSNPFDPEQNIAGGVGYLRLCLDRFNNNVALALAAYNAGPERVARTGGIPPIPETQDYVRNVLQTYTGKAQPAPAAKGARFITPGSGKKSKVIRGPSAAGAAGPDAAADQRRRGPRIIEVRHPAPRSR